MKTKIFGIFIWFASILLVVDIICVGLVIHSGQELEIYIWGLCIVMMIFLPVGLFMWALLVTNNTIIIDNNGVSRVRFKKVIKYFKWEDIKTIGFTSEDSFTGWCYISIENHIKYTYREISKMRMNKNVIYFHLTNKNTEKIKNILNGKQILTK